MGENDDGFVSGEPTPRDPPTSTTTLPVLPEMPPPPTPTSLLRSAIATTSTSSLNTYFMSASSSMSNLNDPRRVRTPHRPPSMSDFNEGPLRETMNSVSLMLQQANHLERMERYNQDLVQENHVLIQDNEELQRANDTLRQEVFDLTSSFNESNQHLRSFDGISQHGRFFAGGETTPAQSVDAGVQATPLQVPFDVNLDKPQPAKGRIKKCLSEDDIYIKPIRSVVRRIDETKGNFARMDSTESTTHPTHPEAAFNRVNAIRVPENIEKVDGEDEDLERQFMQSLTDQLNYATTRSDELEEELKSVAERLTEELTKNARLLEDVGAEQRRAEQAENEAQRLKQASEDIKHRLAASEKDTRELRGKIQENIEKLTQLTTVTQERDQLRRENQKNLTELDYLRHKISNLPEEPQVGELTAKMHILQEERDEAVRKATKAEQDVTEHIAVVKKAAEYEAQLEVAKTELEKKRRDIEKAEADIDKWKEKFEEERIQHLAIQETAQESESRLTQLLASREETVQLLCSRLARHEVITGEDGEVSLELLQPGPGLPSEPRNEDPADELTLISDEQPQEQEQEQEQQQQQQQISPAIFEKLLELLERFSETLDDFTLDVKVAISNLLREIGAQRGVDETVLCDLLNKFLDKIITSYKFDVEKIGERLAETEVDLEAKRQEVAILQERLDEERPAVANARTKQHDLEDRIKKMRDEQRKVDFERGQLCTQVTELKKKLNHQIAVQRNLETDLDKKQSEYEFCAGGLKKAMEELENCDKREAELNIELTNLMEENEILRKENEIMQQSLESRESRELLNNQERAKLEREARMLKCELNRLSSNKENETQHRLSSLEDEMAQVKVAYEKDKATNFESSRILGDGYFKIKQKNAEIRKNHNQLLTATRQIMQRIDECNQMTNEQGNPEITNKLGDISRRYNRVVQNAIEMQRKDEEEMVNEVTRCDRAVEDLRTLHKQQQNTTVTKTHYHHMPGPSSNGVNRDRF